MKRLYQFSLLLLALLLPVSATAQDFIVDGIGYYINWPEEASVASCYYYAGDLTIPATVTYDGITYKVTSIRSGAFYSLEGLTSVTIPNSVSAIGSDAFYGCTNLTSVTIPNSVTTIGSNAFEGTAWYNSQPDGLVYAGLVAYKYKGIVPEGTSITLMEGTLGIAGHAFHGCSGLSSVIIPNSVTHIGEYAFDYCSSLTSIIIPNSVTHIGEHAFYYCSSLTSITIPNSVTIIDYGTFEGCSGLTSIDIPNSVTIIFGSAFKGCTGLTSVNISDIASWCGIDFADSDANPLYYAHHLYLNGSEITDLIIPSSLTSINPNAFEGCTGLTGIIVESGNIIYDSRDNCNAIIETATNTLIAGCKNTTIPNSVTSIGIDAFKGCTGLTSIDIPNSVTIIFESAFKGCTGLTSINIPNSVTSIGCEAFYGCTGLTSVNIPNSVTLIGWEAFANCTGLTSVNITDLEAWCNIDFSYNANPLSYAHHLFMNGEEITDLKIPNTVTSIGSDAFKGCTGLTSVTLPNSITSIGNYAFEYCTGLTSVTIPNSVTSIGSDAFYRCTGLTSVTVDSENPNYDSRDKCNAIILTASNTLIYGCKNTTIPNSVTSIGSDAFKGCTGLTSVTLPNSITSIGNYAFEYCTGLTDVYCLIEEPSKVNTGSSIFYLSSQDYTNRTLHVPAGSLAAYQADTKWNKYFGTIIEIGTEKVLATSVELNHASAELTKGGTLQLTATVMPEDATDKSVTWATSDKNIATVDTVGVVTAVAAGTATITTTTNDGSNLSASCVVTVTEPVVPQGDNVFVINDLETMHGDVVVIPVALINSQTFAAFQTDVFLPEGFSIVTDEDDEYLVTPSERLTSDHVLMTSDANNGSVRVLCYTPNALPIDGSEGELFYITIQVPNDAEGTYTIALRNSLLTTTEYQEISIPDAEGQMEIYAFIPGDVNDSRTVTVTDIVVTAQYVLDRDPSPFIFEAADMNGDGNVTVTDIMLIAYLINHPTMTAPKRMPILDGSNDYMSGEDLTLMAGETRKVSIQLNNEMDYTAFQLDLTLPAGLTANNFQLTDRAGNHAFDVNTLGNGKTRALCYSPAIKVINGHEGALLTFDVTATDDIKGIITMDGIELVTTDCQTALLDAFTIGVNTATSVNELNESKTVARMDYFNLTGHQIDRPGCGVTLVVTTYTDGTRSTTKVIK